MKVLFDQGTPAPLRRQLAGHMVDTVYERGCSTLKNGALLSIAEQAGYDVLMTTDRQLRYQQDLTGRRLAIVVLLTTSWPRIQQRVTAIQAAIDSLTPGDYQEIAFDQAP
jgi:hypothetical protein